MTTQTKQKMSKDEIVAFNLLENYWNYLVSLQEAYKNMLEKVLNESLETWIESANLFETTTGSAIGGGTTESEEIFFQLKNRKTKVSLRISYGQTKNTFMILTEGGDPYEKRYFPPHAFDSGNTTDELFLDKFFDTAILWLKEGVMTPYAKETFISD